MQAKEQVAPLILIGLAIAAILFRVAANRQRDIECPYCGWQVRRSSRHGLREWLLKGLPVLPYRCLACRKPVLSVRTKLSAVRSKAESCPREHEAGPGSHASQSEVSYFFVQYRRSPTRTMR